MSKKFLPIQEQPRTSDEELLKEVTPASIMEQKQQMLSETEVAKSHEEHLERGKQIAELKEVLKSSEKTGKDIQGEIDQIKEQLADKESRILGKIFEIVQIFKLRKTLSGKVAEYQATSEEIQSLKDELNKLEDIHSGTREKLKQTVSDYMSNEDITGEATYRAILEKQIYLESVREARDVYSMCERENCLVFHTLLPKGYYFGTRLKSAPSENSPLDWEKAIEGGVPLQANIALGYDIELSCSTMREGSEDAIWSGAGGFIINGGSVRMGGDHDLGTRVDTQTGRRYRMGGDYGTMSKKGDSIIRTAEDLHLAVAGKGREIAGNHNELIIEEAKVAAIFINLPKDSKVIFTEETDISEYVDENPQKYTGSYPAAYAFSDYLTIAEENNLPVYALFRGRAYRLGPVVQRVERSHNGLRENRIPWKEITLIPGEVSFEEIRHLSGVSEESKCTAKKRVPNDIFRTSNSRGF